MSKTYNKRLQSDSLTLAAEPERWVDMGVILPAALLKNEEVNENR